LAPSPPPPHQPRRRPLAAASAAPRRPPPNPGPARPKRGRREPPAPLLDFGSDDDDDEYDEEDETTTTTTTTTETTETATALLRRRRKAKLEAAYRRVVSQPAFARDGDVRLYFKKRRLLAERAALEDGQAATTTVRRSWVDDNDALPRPETALKLSAEARAQVIDERSESLARALGWEEDVEEQSSSLRFLSSSLLSRHPGLLARATSELASAARGHSRAACLPVNRVLKLSAEAPRLLLAHPDAAEARAGLLGRALVVAGGSRGSGSNNHLPSSALLWRYPSALGTARARPLVEWAEALAAAVARVSVAAPGALTAAVRGPRAGAPAAGVAESLAVLTAGVALIAEQDRLNADEDNEESEGFARDAWLQRAGPEVAAGAVVALAARLATATAPPPSLPLFPLLRAEPALLLRSDEPLRVDAWRRLEATLRALERLFLGEGEGNGSSSPAAATASASRAVLLAPRLVRAIPDDDDDMNVFAALKEALHELSSTEWLFGGGEEEDRQQQQRALAAARRHPRLLLAALEEEAAAMDARADRLARALGVSVEVVRRAARLDPSLLAAPPALVRRAGLRLARGLLGGRSGGGNDADRAAAAELSPRLWLALAASPACAGAWAAAERGWLPLQLRALCTCLRLSAAEVRALLRSSLLLPPMPERPLALAALAASPAELREGYARLTAAFRRLVERRRRQEQSLPASAAEARLAAALLRGAPALAAAALAPELNRVAVAALDGVAAVEAITDDEVVEVVRGALMMMRL
jgi:hypothetical protein